VSRRLAVDYQLEPDWIDAEDASAPADILSAIGDLLEDELFHTSTTYDALNRVATRTTDDGSISIPTYNIGGLLEQLSVGVRGASPRLVIHDIDYNARGQRTLCEHANPESAAGTVTTRIEYSYDAETFRLSELITTRGSTELQHLIYTYDPVGNIVSLRNLADAPYFTGTAPVSGDGSYVYDPLYRLIEASGREHPGQVGVSSQPAPFQPPPGSIPHPNDTQALLKYTETYVYDDVGNIERIRHATQHADNSQGPAWTQWTRRYRNATDSNRLLGTSEPGDPDGTFSAAYEYSEASSNNAGRHGSITRMPHLPGGMSWDYADRLKRADRGGGGVVHFTYDGAGQRVRKVLVLPGTIRERIYLGGYELYRERPNVANAPHAFERQTLHVMDDQRRVALLETKTREAGSDIAAPANLWRFQLDNHLGSSTVELDHQANIISYEEYHPYGSTAFHASSGSTEVSAKRYRYTSKERDEETGLYYHGARYYAPWLGRWMAADPAGIQGGLNLYEYGASSPLIMTDPTGNKPLDSQDRNVQRLRAKGLSDQDIQRLIDLKPMRPRARQGSGGKGGSDVAASSGSSGAASAPNDPAGPPPSAPEPETKGGAGGSGKGSGEKASAADEVGRALAQAAGALNLQGVGGTEGGSKYGSPLGQNPNAEASLLSQIGTSIVGIAVGVWSAISIGKAASAAYGATRAAFAEAFSAGAGAFRGLGSKIAYGFGRLLGNIGKAGPVPTMEPAPPARVAPQQRINELVDDVFNDGSNVGRDIYRKARTALAADSALSPAQKARAFEEMAERINKLDPSWMARRGPATNAAGFFTGEGRPFGFAVDLQGRVWTTPNIGSSVTFGRGGATIDFSAWVLH
jgi:RHS repeat-associated protein